MLLISQDYLSHPWVIDFPIVWSTNISQLKNSTCQVSIKKKLQP